MKMFRLRIAVLALWMGFVSAAALAQSVPPYRQTPLPVAPVNWYTVNDDVTKELYHIELGTLAKQTLTTPPPATPNAWLRQLAIFVRADYPEAVQQKLRARPRFLTQDKDWGLNQLVIEANYYNNMKLARRLCELFPEQTSEYNWFEGWKQTADVKEVDGWLAQRGLAGEGRWFRIRLKYRASLGTVQELLAPLEAQVRRHPDRLDAVETYLQAVQATEKLYDTSWIAKVVRPRLAVENYILGGYLSSKAVAIPLYERALALPFTKQDTAWYADYARRMHFAYLGPNFALTEPVLRQWIQSRLLQLYQETKQTAKAQKLLEKMTTQNPGGLPNSQLAFQAGAVQRESGVRVVEKRIQAAEPERQDTPDYWLSRGLYYSGRKEDKQAVEAFEKGLVLAPMAEDGRLNIRWRISTEYARHLWLRDIENPKDAYAFVRKELDLAPLNSDYARGLITELVHYDQRDASRLIDPADTRLWDFLAEQKDWIVFGRPLLERMIRNTPEGQRADLLQRAETLANAAPTAKRSKALSMLLTSERKYERAAFWIEDALKRAEKKEEKQSLRYDLWRAYTFLNDWRSMVRLLPQMEKEQTTYWLAIAATREIAIAAAESGAKEEAIAYFRKWANQDRRSAPGEIYPLPSHILPVLREYYRNIAQAEPQSVAPARILKMIGE